jgi:hypothetical protein
VVNLSDLDQAFESGAVVDLAAIEAKSLLNISGRDKKLPLKVGQGGRGECRVPALYLNVPCMHQMAGSTLRLPRTDQNCVL